MHSKQQIKWYTHSIIHMLKIKEGWSGKAGLETCRNNTKVSGSMDRNEDYLWCLIIWGTSKQVQLPSGGLGCVLHGRSSHRCCSVSLGGQLRPSVPGVQYLRRYLTPGPQVSEHWDQAAHSLTTVGIGAGRGSVTSGVSGLGVNSKALHCVKAVLWSY